MASPSHSIGTYGPFAFTLSSAGSTPWMPVVPGAANLFYGVLTCGTGTGIVKLQGIGSTASTGTPVAVLQRTSTQKSVQVGSTVTTAIAFVRANSTAIQAGNTLRLSVFRSIA